MAQALEALVQQWRQQARSKLHSAAGETEDWKKRALIHAGTCVANCAMDLEQAMQKGSTHVEAAPARG